MHAPSPSSPQDLVTSSSPATRSSPVQRREIFGWAMFDFANSSYTTVVISFVYSAFFVGWIVPHDAAMRDSWWSLAIVASMVVTLLVSPLAGAICDFSGRKKRWLFGTTVACSLSTAALALTGPGDIALAIVLVIVSNSAFMLSETFCGSFLPDLADEDDMATVSGIGWGIGYFGGLASMILVAVVIVGAKPEEAALAAMVDAPGLFSGVAALPATLGAEIAGFVSRNQLGMIVVGAFFFVSALPTFLLVRDRGRPAPGFERASFGKLFAAGMGEMRRAAQTARDNPALFRFLVAFTVYMAGLSAIVKFVGIYANEEVRLSAALLTVLFLVLQVSAAIGALGFGLLEKRIGPKATVLLTLAWWVVGGLGILALQPVSAVLGMDPQHVFLVIGVIAGSGLGATQSSSRAVVGLLSPPDRTAQMFGFWGLFSRVAGILGMSYGFASDALGSRQLAIVVIIAFFVVGAWLLSAIDLDGAVEEQAARRRALTAG